MSTAPLMLLSAVFTAPAAAVTRWVSPEVISDVGLSDAAVAEALTVCADMAASGLATDPVSVNAECLRRGLLTGHQGELIKSRLIDAVTTPAYAERIREYAAAALAETFRHRLAAAGEAITAASTGPEVDAWATVLAEGARLRVAYERLTSLREVAK